MLRFRVFDADDIGDDEFLGQVDFDIAHAFKMEWRAIGDAVILRTPPC